MASFCSSCDLDFSNQANEYKKIIKETFNLLHNYINQRENQLLDQIDNFVRENKSLSEEIDYNTESLIKSKQDAENAISPNICADISAQMLRPIKEKIETMMRRKALLRTKKMHLELDSSLINSQILKLGRLQLIQADDSNIVTSSYATKKAEEKRLNFHVRQYSPLDFNSSQEISCSNRNSRISLDNPNPPIPISLNSENESFQSNKHFIIFDGIIGSNIHQKERILQKNEVKLALSKSKRVDSIWYLINNEWWNNWINFVDFNETGNYSDESPGIINNSNLLDLNRKLKPNLRENVDFSILPPETWQKFNEWYGVYSFSCEIYKLAKRNALGKLYIKVYD